MIEVAIFDDNKSRRESLELLLQLSPDYEHVGSYANGTGFEEAFLQKPPQVVLMDIEMPEVNGIEAIEKIKQRWPQILIVVQTAFDDDEKVFASLKAGAEGYILKSASVNTILQAIDDVLKGGASMSPSIALKVMKYFSGGQRAQEKKADWKLSTKEQEVLTYLSDGLSYKMVADKMGISYFTVNNHIKKIYEKLQVHSMGEAIAKAHKQRLF
ncbi:MAG: response regulator transcription factor [Saprospiraceae bacterium]|nr:response regulator transcription factor [Saprospiraceae bacterium]